MPRIGELSLSGDVRIDGDLNFVGEQSITTTTAADLNIVPGAGGITVIGDAGTTSHTLNANDDLFVTGKLEVDGSAYFDGTLYIYSAAEARNDIPIGFGNSTLASMRWETADIDAQCLLLALPVGGSATVPLLVIGDTGVINQNLGWFNGQTIPRIAMVAADEGGYFAFGVDNSNILDIKATTAPTADNDETKFSHKLQCVINGDTYYIMLTQT